MDQDQDQLATVAKGEIPFHDLGPELRLGEGLGTEGFPSPPPAPSRPQAMRNAEDMRADA